MITVQTKKIAEAGAKKMPGLYEVKAGSIKSLGQYWVKKIATGKKYLVNPSEERPFCTCPFAREHGHCKHVEHVRDLLAWEASVIAREEEMAF